MNIIITGTADKRPIVYPLLYALNFLGNTLLLTNDTIFRRLLPGGAENGEIGNIHMETTARLVPEIEHYYEYLAKEFENHIIVTFEETTIQGNKIHVLNDGKNTVDETKSDAFLPQRQSNIRIGYAPKKEKEHFIGLNDSLYRQLYQMEINSRVVPLKDSQILKVLTQVFSPIFGKNEKDMKKLLLYKGGKIT